MLALPGDQFITRCLEVYGEFSRGEWQLLDQVIKPGMTVVEVGANIGAHTVAMAKACHPAPLYAFEPQRRVFQILCANLALNDVENVFAYPDACGAEAGTAMAPAIDYGAHGNFGGVSMMDPGGSGEAVRVITLDSLQLKSCGLIKVDVEGFEHQVLTGAAETIARCRPILYVENDRAKHQRALIKLIHEMGYQLYWHTPPLAGPDNFNGVDKLVFDKNYLSINMICLPQERPSQTDMEPIDPTDPRLPGALSPDRAPVGG